MKRLTLALAAAALGAGAVYFLDPRNGPRRRSLWQSRAGDWLHQLQDQTAGPAHALGDTVGRLKQRLRAHAHEDEVPDDGLTPLDMTPAPLEKENHRMRLLPALAMAATPVAMAVGAALLRQRSEEGEWLH
jgi:hypothetical protein